MAVRVTFGQWGFGNGGTQSWIWAAAAAFGWPLLALLVVLLPAWRDALSTSFTVARIRWRQLAPPRWERIGLDVILLALAGIVFWQQSQDGYQLVLAPRRRAPHFGLLLLIRCAFAPLGRRSSAGNETDANGDVSRWARRHRPFTAGRGTTGPARGRIH